MDHMKCENRMIISLNTHGLRRAKIVGYCIDCEVAFVPYRKI